MGLAAEGGKAKKQDVSGKCVVFWPWYPRPPKNTWPNKRFGNPLITEFFESAPDVKDRKSRVVFARNGAKTLGADGRALLPTTACTVGLLADDTLSNTAGSFNFERLIGWWRGRGFPPPSLFPRLPSLPYDIDRSTLNGPAVASATLPSRRQQTNQP